MGPWLGTGYRAIDRFVPHAETESDLENAAVPRRSERHLRGGWWRPDLLVGREDSKLRMAESKSPDKGNGARTATSACKRRLLPDHRDWLTRAISASIEADIARRH
jgi:hypothetical protein